MPSFSFVSSEVNAAFRGRQAIVSAWIQFPELDTHPPGEGGFAGVLRAPGRVRVGAGLRQCRRQALVARWCLIVVGCYQPVVGGQWWTDWSPAGDPT